MWHLIPIIAEQAAGNLVNCIIGLYELCGWFVGVHINCARDAICIVCILDIWRELTCVNAANLRWGAVSYINCVS